MESTYQPTGQSDAELLDLSLSGDEAAFLLLYQRLKSGIFRYAFYMTNSNSTAEEVTRGFHLPSERRMQISHRPGRRSRVCFWHRPQFCAAHRTSRACVSTAATRPRARNIVCESDFGVGSPAGPTDPQRAGETRTGSGRLAPRSLSPGSRSVRFMRALLRRRAFRLRCAVGTIRSRLNRAHALLAHRLKPLRSPEPNIEAAGPEGCTI